MSSTVTINNTCLKGNSGDTLQALGDGFTIAFSMFGIVFNCICLSVFIFWATTTKSAREIPIIISICCALSLMTSVYKYFTAQSDIDNLKKSGKLTAC